MGNHQSKLAVRQNISIGGYMADLRRSKSGWACIGIGGGFAIEMPGGFEFGISGFFTEIRTRKGRKKHNIQKGSVFLR